MTIEKLHQQLYEINALYPRHVTELQGKIQALEKQNQELQVRRLLPSIEWTQRTITGLLKDNPLTILPFYLLDLCESHRWMSNALGLPTKTQLP